MSSSKPRIQRRRRYNAPMHIRQHFVHAHIDKALRAKMTVKRRAIQIVKGDTVKVMSGAKRGTSGKVMEVNLKSGRIFIDSLKKKNAKGKEFNVGISSSNVYITELNLTDKRRAEALKLKVQPKEKALPEPEKKEQKPADATLQHKVDAIEKKADMEKAGQRV